MIKSKYGFHEYDNGYAKVFILDANISSFMLALEMQSFSMLEEIACLILDNDGLPTKQRWQEVRDKIRLINKVKELKRNLD